MKITVKDVIIACDNPREEIEKQLRKAGFILSGSLCVNDLQPNPRAIKISEYTAEVSLIKPVAEVAPEHKNTQPQTNPFMDLAMAFFGPLRQDPTAAEAQEKLPRQPEHFMVKARGVDLSEACRNLFADAKGRGMTIKSYKAIDVFPGYYQNVYTFSVEAFEDSRV